MKEFSLKFTSLTEYSNKAIIFHKEHAIPSDFFPELPLLYRHILYRKKLNMDTIIVVCGAKRSGKTYFSLKSCEFLSNLENKKFSIKDNVFFDTLPFLKFMKNAKESYCILEEVGVGYNAQEWYEINCKIFRNIMQTQGFRKNVIFMTLPNISYLLKPARFLCNFGVETVQIGIVNIFKITIKHLLGKGWLDYIETLKFSLPSKEIIEEYEKLKEEWNNYQIQKDIELITNMEFVENKDYILKDEMKPMFLIE